MLFAFVSPTLLMVLGALAFYFNLHRRALAMSAEALPQLIPPQKNQRLLVIAPHCDDETLGAGGLIAQARERGIPVKVVFLTSGDAFPAACALVTRRLPTQAGDYIRLGEHRQQEAQRALEHLGVAKEDISFLGYPDKGLTALWQEHWGPEIPFRSPYTGRSATPRGPYCGSALLKDLTQAITEFAPTDIYVTHPADDHLDHSTAASFAEAALVRSSLTFRAKLHYYIIHRGDWPLPQGYSPTSHLLPPTGFTLADTHWGSLPLTTENRAAKERALDAYPSQLEPCGRQLRSFLRQNEVFGALRVPQVTSGQPATARDAQGDDVVRFANPATDLTQLSVQRDAENLRLALRLRGGATPGIRYTLRLRTESGAYLVRNLPPPQLVRPGTQELSATIPLTALGSDPTNLWISAETGMTTRYIVDRTGYRHFTLASP